MAKKIFKDTEYTTSKIQEHNEGNTVHPDIRNQIKVLSDDRGYLNSKNVNQAHIDTLIENGKYMNVSGMPANGTWVVDVTKYVQNFVHQRAHCIYDSVGLGYSGMTVERDCFDGIWKPWTNLSHEINDLFQFRGTITSMSQIDADGYYYVAVGDGTFPYEWGILTIKSGNGEKVATYNTTGDDKKVYDNVKVSGQNWRGWECDVNKINALRGKSFINQGLGGIDVDTQKGNWINGTAVTEQDSSDPPFPASWKNYIQFDCDHFITQFAVDQTNCDKIAFRGKYITTDWDKWHTLATTSKIDTLFPFNVGFKTWGYRTSVIEKDGAGRGLIVCYVQKEDGVDFTAGQFYSVCVLPQGYHSKWNQDTSGTAIFLNGTPIGTCMGGLYNQTLTLVPQVNCGVMCITFPYSIK